MNRTVSQAAALFDMPSRSLFAKLRELKIINQQRELISSERQAGRFFTDARSRWNKSINSYTHYGVVMITEDGVQWLAKQLCITINCTKAKDAA